MSTKPLLFSQEQGILFDLDGTLLDTAPTLEKAANRLYQAHHLALESFEGLKHFAGEGSLAYIRHRFGENPPYLVQLRQEFIQYYLHYFDESATFFPGIPEILTTLTKLGYPWGIVTNKPKALTRHCLDQFSLLQQAKTVISGDTLPQSKPDPAPVFLACHQLKRQPKNCFFIGDHARDIEAGSRAGTQTIIAGYGYIPSLNELPQWGANFSLFSVQELSYLLFADYT